jgi:hypothetical protein
MMGVQTTRALAPPLISEGESALARTCQLHTKKNLF